MLSGRVIEVHRTNFIVSTVGGEVTATVRGNFHAEKDFPKVGDYVTLESLDDGKAVIESVKDRMSVIKRKSADSDEEQIIATNVDLIFIVLGLDGDFSVSRLERYLLLAEQSNIEAVVVLNKVDLVDDIDFYADKVNEVVGNMPVIQISALSGTGMDIFSDYLSPATTSVLLGSSGAGKSTITNWLLNKDEQAVRATRDGDSRGRHTTTSRQLFSLPNGAYIIDTPGMRELGVLETNAEEVLAVFEKIETLANECKFSNCDHEKSAGCAVMVALESGDLSERELNNYYKLLREQSFQDSKESSTSSRHQEQNKKRLSQKHAATQRQKLSRRLR